ncbi:MAG: response regulator [Chloroflexota bacterium]
MSKSETKGHVLIVDDQERWRKTIAQLLKLRKYTSSEASDMMSALEKLESETFDVVTLDMQFEDHGDAFGETLLELVRSEYPHIACVMISGSIDSFSKVSDLTSKAHGLGAFIHKNELTPSELEKAIERAQQAIEDQQSEPQADTLIQEHEKYLRELEKRLISEKNALARHYSHLSKTEEKASKYGLDVPIKLTNEIEEYQARIEKDEEDIEAIQTEIVETQKKIEALKS